MIVEASDSMPDKGMLTWTVGACHCEESPSDCLHHSRRPERNGVIAETCLPFVVAPVANRNCVPADCSHPSFISIDTDVSTGEVRNAKGFPCRRGWLCTRFTG